MDIDELIREADPARHLSVHPPDPGAILRHDRPTRRDHLAGLLALGVVVGVVAVIALVVLSVRVDRSPAPATVPSRLPFGAPVRPSGPSGAVRQTARLVVRVPDPESGPAWALRTYVTRGGKTCLQVGRSESGFVGAIGAYGAYGDDGRFHRFAFGELGLGDCVVNDARGHGFLTSGTGADSASAVEEPCQRPGAQNCPDSALRAVYFGLLGPDATTITYLGQHGRRLTERTHAPDGGYLIVLPVRSEPGCSRQLFQQIRQRLLRTRAPTGSIICQTQTGTSEYAGLRSGEITSVTYRDGHTCRLPAPRGHFLPFAQCPVVGYAPPAGPSYTEAQVRAPVSVQEIPAHYYCVPGGRYRPGALAIPCDGAVPHGYFRDQITSVKGGVRTSRPADDFLVYVSWTARAPVRNINDSSYAIGVSYPRGCGSGGESGASGMVIRAGQRITRYFLVPRNCPGTDTGEVDYIPDLGPGGRGGGLLQGAGVGVGRAKGVLLVGQFKFTVP
jgi:hypothetical protein